LLPAIADIVNQSISARLICRFGQAHKSDLVSKQELIEVHEYSPISGSTTVSQPTNANLILVGKNNNSDKNSFVKLHFSFTDFPEFFKLPMKKLHINFIIQYCFLKINVYSY
jgi:hypothetical protein